MWMRSGDGMRCRKCTPLSWRSGSLNASAAGVSVDDVLAVHSAVVAEWESQYVHGGYRVGPGRGVHSAVVAEWESQWCGSWRSRHSPPMCTPLSWRSGSLNHMYGTSIARITKACTPLSWRSGSLNIWGR